MTERRLPLVLGLAVLLAALVAVLGIVLLHVPVGWAIVLAAPIGALLALLLGTPIPGDHGWPPPPEAPSAQPSRQFALLQDRLADAATDPERFRSRIRPELQRIALNRLRERPGTRDVGTLADPRVRAALGAELYDLLTAPDATLPDPARLSTVLDQLETL